MRPTPCLEEIAGRYAEGQATAAEVLELETALRADPALRQWFLRYLNVDCMLALVGSASLGGTRIRRPASPWRIAGWSAAAAAVLVSLIVVSLRNHRLEADRAAVSSNSRNAQPVAGTAPSVILIASTQARWADGDMELSLRSGDLPAGFLRLESGCVEFQFTDGGTALLLGPATIRFPGRNHIQLHEGKMLCRCPTPQSRLTVTTPATQVVDLGTEFAVAVPAGRSDTRVAVVSGEVRVGTMQSQVLRTGQAAEVGPDQVVRLTPIPPAALAELLVAAAGHSAVNDSVQNLLADPQFTTDLSAIPWRGLEGHVEPSPVDDSVRIFARGHRFWPSLRQEVETGDVTGRLVVAVVEGRTPSTDPLTERQSAILKIAFLDAQGREFATASRHFLHAGSSTFAPDEKVTNQVAAFAPSGTRKIQFQLMISARGRTGGMVEFSNPRLAVLPASATPSLPPQTLMRRSSVRQGQPPSFQ